MTHIVYILYSSTLDRYYIGETSNIEKRLQFHKTALPHKFTAKANDWRVFHTMECIDKHQALQIEKHIKRMKSKIYIQNIKKYPDIFEKLVLKYK